MYGKFAAFSSLSTVILAGWMIGQSGCRARDQGQTSLQADGAASDDVVAAPAEYHSVLTPGQIKQIYDLQVKNSSFWPIPKLEEASAKPNGGMGAVLVYDANNPQRLLAAVLLHKHMKYGTELIGVDNRTRFAPSFTVVETMSVDPEILDATSVTRSLIRYFDSDSESGSVPMIFKTLANDSAATGLAKEIEFSKLDINNPGQVSGDDQGLKDYTKPEVYIRNGAGSPNMQGVIRRFLEVESKLRYLRPADREGPDATAMAVIRERFDDLGIHYRKYRGLYKNLLSLKQERLISIFESMSSPKKSTLVLGPAGEGKSHYGNAVMAILARTEYEWIKDSSGEIIDVKIISTDIPDRPGDAKYDLARKVLNTLRPGFIQLKITEDGIVAGTHWRGDLEQLFKALNEVGSGLYGKKLVLWMDEIAHMDKHLKQFKDAMATGQMKVVGATIKAEWRSTDSYKDPAMRSRFTEVEFEQMKVSEIAELVLKEHNSKKNLLEKINTTADPKRMAEIVAKVAIAAAASRGRAREPLDGLYAHLSGTTQSLSLEQLELKALAFYGLTPQTIFAFDNPTVKLQKIAKPLLAMFPNDEAKRRQFQGLVVDSYAKGQNSNLVITKAPGNSDAELFAKQFGQITGRPVKKLDVGQYYSKTANDLLYGLMELTDSYAKGDGLAVVYVENFNDAPQEIRNGLLAAIANRSMLIKFRPDLPAQEVVIPNLTFIVGVPRGKEFMGRGSDSYPLQYEASSPDKSEKVRGFVERLPALIEAEPDLEELKGKITREEYASIVEGYIKKLRVEQPNSLTETHLVAAVRRFAVAKGLFAPCESAVNLAKAAGESDSSN